MFLPSPIASPSVPLYLVTVLRRVAARIRAFLPQYRVLLAELPAELPSTHQNSSQGVKSLAFAIMAQLPGLQFPKNIIGGGWLHPSTII